MERFDEGVAVLKKSIGQRRQHGPYGLLMRLAIGLLGGFGPVVLFFAHREVLEGALPLKTGQTFRADPEVESEGTLHGDLAEAKMAGGEDLAVLVLLEDVQQLYNLGGAFGRNLAALVAQALAHRHPERGGVDELNLALACRGFTVG